MFTYLRYFSIVSFLLVLIAAIFVGAYFRSVTATNIIKPTIEKSNMSTAQFIAQNVWEKNKDHIDQFWNQPSYEWRQNPYFLQFAKDMFLYIKNMPLSVVKVSLYTVTGEKFFSSNPYEITTEPTWFQNTNVTESQQTGFQQARSGVVQSHILTHSAYRNRDGMLVKGTLIRTFVPIALDYQVTKDVGNGNSVKAVMEVFYEINHAWDYLTYFQIISTSAIILVFAILYSALFYTSGRAEKIIEKQHEANIELTVAKERAENESKEKSQFLANISHELRTPLNAIIGFSEIIRDETLGPINNPQYKDYVQDIYASGSHLLSLINDILDFSKAEASKLQVDKIEVDVTKVIKNSLRLMAPRAEEAKVTLLDDLPKEHLVIIADPKRLKQILLNLLSNSVKFTPEKGSVTLSAWRDETQECVFIRVTDTGIGIAPKDISKAMATFGQVDSKLSRRYEGTGLGLPLTKKLVELMGGTFDIQSELGLGTTIILTFPFGAVANLQ